MSQLDNKPFHPLRNASVDMLKLIMASMIVALHTHFLASDYPLLSYLLNEGIFRIAVPIFFIINGYFFDATPKNAKKWFQCILILDVYLRPVVANR